MQSRTSTAQSSGQPGIRVQCPHTLMYNGPTIAPSWLNKNSWTKEDWRNWHHLHTPESKWLLNTATRELKQLLSDNNACFQAFLQDLSPTASTDYSLWKAAKRTKKAPNSSLPLQTARGTWAWTNIEKAQTFAEHQASVFQPHPPKNDPEDNKRLNLELESPRQLEPPPRRFRQSEVQAIINNFKAKRSPGYDLIPSGITSHSSKISLTAF
jgi:hypothetical protein